MRHFLLYIQRIFNHFFFSNKPITKALISASLFEGIFFLLFLNKQNDSK
jgi:hypothetical protein